MKQAPSLRLAMLGMTALLLLFPACNGIMSDIYDEPSAENTPEFGFTETDKENNSGTIYINTSSYTQWTYINFHTLGIDSARISEQMVEPSEWDIAVHRYDVKTNGASVLETGFTGFATLVSSGTIPEGNYVADEWTTDRIVVDMSGMMEGNLEYAESYYNAELSKWLFVDTGTMPPGYYPSNKVYIVKFKDQTVGALRLKNFMNASGAKGYMTIEYLYPLEM